VAQVQGAAKPAHQDSCINKGDFTEEPAKDPVEGIGHVRAPGNAKEPSKAETRWPLRTVGMPPTIAPDANPGTRTPRLRFVVQKHWARNLHYDLRLEIGAALVSWAVPKGPSKDPSVKRLAIHVEDHPLDYLLFEETLPEGEYGAGEVIVWDFGEFEVVGPVGHDAAAALGDGIIRFVLYGTKLRGQWTIIRTKMGKGPRENWLLQKIVDEFAVADYNPETEPASALSGKVPRNRP